MAQEGLVLFEDIEMFSLEEMAAILLSAAALEHEMHHTMKKVGELVEKEAKAAIGTYKFKWPELAESTQEDRSRQGFPANEPLLRTGELRDSIGHRAEGASVSIGSNNDKAVWQELGTARIPPRPFLQGAALEKKDEILNMIGEDYVKRLMGSGG